MIKLTIKENEYTIEEASELYNELKALFGEDKPVFPYYPPVNIPWVQPCEPTPLNPYYTISTTGGEASWLVMGEEQPTPGYEL